jgi:hypothetical protein
MIKIIQDAIHDEYIKDNNLLKLINRTYDIIMQFNDEYISRADFAMEVLQLDETNYIFNSQILTALEEEYLQ